MNFFQAKETKAAKIKKAAERVDDSKYELYINFSCPASRDNDITIEWDSFSSNLTCYESEAFLARTFEVCL